MVAPAPTSRSRAPPAGDEEASTVLKLGEFQDVDALTHSEAALVINALVAKRRGDRKNVNETEILSKTQEYLDHFARFKRKENVEAVERLLGSRGELAKFERAQLGRFFCYVFWAMGVLYLIEEEEGRREINTDGDHLPFVKDWATTRLFWRSNTDIRPRFIVL